jgi:hypothetical protein
VAGGPVIVLAVPLPPAPPPGVDRFLSPTGVAALLIFAFIIDYFAVGPAWLQTRLTFIAAVTGFRQGFDAGPLDTWTVEKGQAVIQMALDQAEGSYIAGAVPLSILGIGVGILSVYTIGCMVPVKASKKLGRIATVTFKETGIRKITWPVWILALPLALLAELPHGWMGLATTFMVDNIYAFVGAPIPELVFGVA